MGEATELTGGVGVRCLLLMVLVPAPFSVFPHFPSCQGNELILRPSLQFIFAAGPLLCAPSPHSDQLSR